jgi:hypothetical protein
VTIGILPDEILLEIFDFYMHKADYDEWHTLVHVCRQWRNVVFASPRRLDLRLLCCEYGRSVRKMLDLWPELPIVIRNDIDDSGDSILMAERVDNVIDALELNDRVSKIDLWDISSSELEIYLATMQCPFPALTDLTLSSFDELARAQVMSDSFLGGSAPRLRSLNWHRIPFPELPKLLLSTTDLGSLYLESIPHSGYFSPEAIVTCLSSLTRLKDLALEFQSPRSRPSRTSRLRPPLTRTILPALTYLRFKGVTEYLEDLVARIDVPLLDIIRIKFFNQLVFDILQLPKLVFRTKKFTEFNQADVVLESNCINVTLSLQTATVVTAELRLKTSCRALDWQLSSLAQVCELCLPTLSNLEYLNIRGNEPPDLPLLWQDDIENTQWLEVLQPFVTVKNLYLSNKVAPYVSPALQGLAGERATEVLPMLQALVLDAPQPSGPVEGAFREFVAVRQLSGHPVAIRYGRSMIDR